LIVGARGAIGAGAVRGGFTAAATSDRQNDSGTHEIKYLSPHDTLASE
jgi:hypothetical protein